jgi:hypothetical protein
LWVLPYNPTKKRYRFLLLPNSESTNIGIKPGRQLPPKRD